MAVSAPCGRRRASTIRTILILLCLVSYAFAFNWKSDVHAGVTTRPGRYALMLKLHSPEAQRDVFLALNPKLLDGENFHSLGMIDMAK